MLDDKDPRQCYLYRLSRKPAISNFWQPEKLRTSLFLSSSYTRQLTLSELWVLAGEPGLEFFQRVVFVSSVQDKYVPFGSARCELSSDGGHGNSVISEPRPSKKN